MNDVSVRADENPATDPFPILIPDRLAQTLRHHLADWYGRHHRALPWRKTADPYRIWISEIMLQQTQVATVIPYYDRFLSRFPDVSALAAADLQDVLKIWEGLGYYARARHLHRAAGTVVAEHGGRFPADPAAVRSLPGIGGYVAAAILSFAFGKPYAVVDGNVKRLLSRLFAIDAPVNRPSSHRLFQEIADRLLDFDRPALHNQAVMEMGALVCRPKSPFCADCPLAGECRAYRDGTVCRYPVRDRKSPVPEYRMAIGVIRKNGRVLIVRRPENGLLGGLWEFPGLTVDDGKTPETALRHYLLETLRLRVEGGIKVADVRHAYSHFKVAAEVFSCSVAGGRLPRTGRPEMQWVTVRETARYPFTGLARKIVKGGFASTPHR